VGTKTSSKKCIRLILALDTPTLDELSGNLRDHSLPTN